MGEVLPVDETDGNIEYYRCTVCGELFFDDDCTSLATAEDVILSNVIDLSKVTGDVVAKNNSILKNTLSGDYNISVEDGATVTLRNAKINMSSYNNKAGLTLNGSATVILDGENTLKGGAYASALYVPESKTLTVKGSGSLNATGGTDSAGIGSGCIDNAKTVKAGNIVIESGTVTAKGCGDSSAGIGSGYLGSCGNITISGGTVTATSDSDGNSGAGIGCGYNGSCENITISGGTVTAKGGFGSAGIGSGYNGSCESVTVTNDVTKVTAIKGEDAASIGAGYGGSCGTVTIGGVTGARNENPFVFPNLVTDITINNIPTGYIATDTTGTLTATITPSDAFYNTVTWTSDNTSVLTIDETGKYTAVSAGSATVTAKTPEGNTATCTINVKVPVTDITINDVPTGYIAVDTTGTLTATISPNNATFNTVEWTSDNAGVLTIDETGKYTAVSAGSATATADGKSATCTINVKVPVTDTTINNVPAEYIVPDTTGTLTATVSPNNATFNTVTWTSNNTSVLTIDETGKYTAVSAGSATVTATADGKSATCTITVRKITLVDLSTITSNYTAQNDTVLTGTLSGSYKITVAENATVTLRNVTINGGNNQKNNWAGITCPGNATLILEGNNAVKSFYENYPAIHIASGKTLTIKGDGSLNAKGGDYACGIGGGRQKDNGNIVIEGGTITAKSGYRTAKSAAIGSGFEASGGTVTIKGTITKVTAVRGATSAQVNNHIGLGDAYNGSCGAVTIDPSLIDTTNGDTRTLRPIVDLSKLTGDYTAQNGDVLTGTLTEKYKITVEDNAAVTFKNVTVVGADSGTSKWAGVNCPGNATLIFEGNNTVKGFYEDYPAIYIAPDKTLTIKGSGSLKATGGTYGCGIGGGYNMDCGNIVIEGGTVTAISGTNYQCTAIGAFGERSCGDITIKDTVTKVTAIKGTPSASPYSIGRGSASGSCGTITIGGVVTDSISTSPYVYQP